LQALLSVFEIDIRPFGSLSTTEVTDIYLLEIRARIIRSEGVVEVVLLDDDLLAIVGLVSSDPKKACSKVQAIDSIIRDSVCGNMNKMLTQNPPCDLYDISKPSERVLKQTINATKPSEVVRNTGRSVNALSNSPYL
jgi:hypothetical protein